MLGTYEVKAREGHGPWRTVFHREATRAATAEPVADAAIAHYEEVRTRMRVGASVNDELKLTRDGAQLARCEARWVRRP